MTLDNQTVCCTQKQIIITEVSPFFKFIFLNLLIQVWVFKCYTLSQVLKHFPTPYCHNLVLFLKNKMSVQFYKYFIWYISRKNCVPKCILMLNLFTNAWIALIKNLFSKNSNPAKNRLVPIVKCHWKSGIKCYFKQLKTYFSLIWYYLQSHTNKKYQNFVL